jgi:hypothetical protein
MRNHDKSFRVRWEIDICAATPEEAVRQAVDWLAPMEPGRWCYQAVDTESGTETLHEGRELGLVRLTDQ